MCVSHAPPSSKHTEVMRDKDAGVNRLLESGFVVFLSSFFYPNYSFKYEKNELLENDFVLVLFCLYMGVFKLNLK